MRIHIAAAVLAVGLTSGCAAEASPAPTLEWRACAENSDVQCATVQVPIDWSRPEGEQIGIAVARRPAADPAQRIGPLISMPGGPGTSGVDEMLKGRKFSAELHNRFDVISFDPRGVGRSHPIRCDAGLASAQLNLVPGPDVQLVDVHAHARELAASCRAHSGALLDHVDAVSVARDIEAVRAALDAERITLYGRSYGTMPGQAYTELFPAHVRAVLLDSVDDHSLDGAAFLASEARAGQHAFDEFARWCVRTASCALHGRDVGALYGDLFDRARRHELRDPARPGTSVTALELSIATTMPLYKPDWPALAQTLRALDEQPRQQPVAPVAPVASGTAKPMPEVIFCADWTFDIPAHADWERLWQQQNRNAPTVRTHFAWSAASLCSGWPVRAANPPHVPRLPATLPPTLLMNGSHDPATPLEWAQGVQRNTPGAALLVYAGPGHGIYDRSVCTVGAADRFLVDLTFPAPPAACPAA